MTAPLHWRLSARQPQLAREYKAVARDVACIACLMAQRVSSVSNLLVRAQKLEAMR